MIIPMSVVTSTSTVATKTNVCTTVGNAWPAFSVPGICSSGMRWRNLKIAVVVAKDPMPSVSKKLVTKPVTVSRNPGRSRPPGAPRAIDPPAPDKEECQYDQHTQENQAGGIRKAHESGRVCIGVGIIAEIRRQPTLRFLQADASAGRVVLHLIQVDLSDREIARFGM